MRHVRSIGMVCLLALAGCLWLSGATAQARVVHVFEKTFGSEGTGAGQFKRPLGVAVNNVTHNVYVVDSGNNRVEEFTSAGSFIREFNGAGAPTGAFSNPVSITVDNSGNLLSAGDVYVVDSGHDVVDKFTENGSYLGQLTGTTCALPEGYLLGEVVVCPKSGTTHSFTNLQGVVVDHNGTVWTLDEKPVYNPADHSTYKWTTFDTFSDGQPSEPLTMRATIYGGGLRPQFALDSEDNIYLNPGSTAKASSSGSGLINPYCGLIIQGRYAPEAESASGVAIDPVEGTAYVEHAGVIAECDLAGKEIERFGSGHLTASEDVAVDGSVGEASSEAVYASETSGRVAVFAVVTLPTVSVTALTEQQPRSVTLNGTIDPEGHSVTSCVFEYGLTSAYGQSVPCSPVNIGSGVGPVAVSAHVPSLVPGSAYHYRLVASNSGGSEPSTDHEFVTGPRLGGEYVTEVTSDGATLNVSLDANGGDTHYFFEYGPTVGYGSFAPVSPPGLDIGSAVGAQALSVRLQGLQSGAVYHYRMFAEQGGELFEERDGAFRTQVAAVAAGSGLPDGRAWELVSPAVNHGTVIEFLNGFSDDIQAAADGSAIYYRTLNQLGEGVLGKGVSSYVLSSRGGSGWSSRDLTLPDVLPPEGDEPAGNLGGPEYLVFSPDLSSAIVEAHAYTPPLAPGVKERTLYLRDLSVESSFLPLVTPENTPPGTAIGTERPEPIRVYAVTPDLEHVVIHSPAEDAGVHPPVPLTEGGYSELYEWGAGRLAAVGVLPNETDDEGSVDLAGQGDGLGAAQRAISDDGRWIAWTAGDPYNKPAVPLYVRDMVNEKTLRVGGADPRYQTMNSTGSKIFYLENGDLYLFETETETTTDLTVKHGAGEKSAGVQEAVSDVNEDGSYVYFVATGMLANGAQAGQPNLYVLHDSEGSWSEPALVATLSWEDEHSWYASAFNQGSSAPGLDNVSSRVSPDGQYLVFMSERSLTGYDNRDAVSGQPDEEVYLYDAAGESGKGRLVCVSCDPTGARPNGVLDKRYAEPLVDRGGEWSGREFGEHEHWLAGSVPGWDEGEHKRSMYQPRYLLNNGRVLFDSPDTLVPQATNGLEDVYEYEPPGVGSCTTGSQTFDEPAMGCVNLISSGISSKESAFYDASENGDDVFFITAAKLVGEDRDTTYDVYDAHVCDGEGVPCSQEPVRPPACTNEESCRAAPSPQPAIFGTPPSATFSGAGNISAAGSASAVTPRRLTRAQQLARALRACHANPRRKRTLCEKKARKRYGSSTTRNTGKASNRHGKGGR